MTSVITQPSFGICLDIFIGNRSLLSASWCWSLSCGWRILFERMPVYGCLFPIQQTKKAHVSLLPNPHSGSRSRQTTGFFWKIRGRLARIDNLSSSWGCGSSRVFNQRELTWLISTPIHHVKSKNVYDIWMPMHLKRICSAIDDIPSDLNFEVSQQSEEVVGLSPSESIIKDRAMVGDHFWSFDRPLISSLVRPVISSVEPHPLLIIWFSRCSTRLFLFFLSFLSELLWQKRPTQVKISCFYPTMHPDLLTVTHVDRITSSLCSTFAPSSKPDFCLASSCL